MIDKGVLLAKRPRVQSVRRPEGVRQGRPKNSTFNGWKSFVSAVEEKGVCGLTLAHLTWERWLDPPSATYSRSVSVTVSHVYIQAYHPGIMDIFR